MRLEPKCLYKIRKLFLDIGLRRYGEAWKRRPQLRPVCGQAAVKKSLVIVP